MSSTRRSSSYSSRCRSSRSISAPARSRSHRKKRRRRHHRRYRSRSRRRRSRSRSRSRNRSRSHSWSQPHHDRKRKCSRTSSRSLRRRSSKRKRRHKRDKNTTILVMGVYGFRKSKIRNFFSEEYGPCSVWIEDEEGYAFVDFRHNLDAEDALECTRIHGTNISCRWHVGKGLIDLDGHGAKGFLRFPNGRDTEPLKPLLLNSSSSSSGSESAKRYRKSVVKTSPPDTEKLKDVAASIAEKIANLRRAEKKES